jgi:UDP-N-acetylmuramoyl-tripeptide--D-alanyl-D-alanine ligase
MFTIEELIQITEGRLLNTDNNQLDSNTKILSFHFDSRELEKDSLFIALTGGVRDGHDFLLDAIEKGAVAALISDEDVDPLYGKELNLILVKDTEVALQAIASAYRTYLTLPIIAITGSNGKTTTKDIVSHILSYKYNVYKTYGSFNNQLGLPLSLLQIAEHHEAAVLELGMNHSGEIDFLANIAKPTVSIITNVADAHIEFLGSRENIAKAKGELLPHTDPTQYILLNQDDPLVCSQSSRYPGKVYYYSTQSTADIYASSIHSVDRGTSFDLHIGEEVFPCFIPIFGKHNVSNVLPGALIAYLKGFSMKDIADSLLSLTISEMRFQVIPGPEESILINDAFNASPLSMKAAIDTLSEVFPQRKKIVVLGDMFELGDQSAVLHSEVGLYLKDKDFTVITVGEKAECISKQANGKHFPTKEKAVQELKQYLDKEHVILFKASKVMKFPWMISTLTQA